jgi:phage repressor protein C with HTH and peptisase S24 domain
MAINIGEKLKSIRKALNLSQIEFAKKLNISERSLRDYEKNRFNVNYDLLSQLINDYNVNSDWIFKDEGNLFTTEKKGIVKADHRNDLISKESSDNLVHIPYLDLKAAAGNGIDVQQEKVFSLVAFNKQWMKQHISSLPGHLSAINAEGDSMEPTIKNGDLILVDHYKNTPQDGLYVIRLGESLVVKRTQCLPNYKMEVLSDNPVYKPYIIDFKSDQDVAIIGKVVWYGRFMG